MGRPATISDFLVDTNGHCFICLSKASPQSQYSSDGLELGPASTSFASVHALSQYLKMDMSKVFHEKDTIPSSLLETVRRSKLKVSLCEQCSKWNNKIGELCRQLEKIQTEVMFYLGLIQGSVLRSDKDNKSNLLYKFQNEMNPNGGLLEKVRIVEALRTEALERCSNKLETDGQPQVKIRNLTAKQVFSKTQSFKFKSQKIRASNNPNKGKCSDSAIPFSDGDQIKTEGSETGKDVYFDEGDLEPMDHAISEDVEDFNYAGMNEDDNLPIHETEPTTIETETNREPTNAAISKPSAKELRPTPTASTKSVQKLTYEINPETGKFKCSICSVESTSKGNLKKHYDSIHLKIKHKCNLCGKEFSQLSNYKTHHRTVHVGVRFKCNLCGKCFTQKRYLIVHQQTVHLEKR